MENTLATTDNNISFPNRGTLEVPRPIPRYAGMPRKAASPLHVIEVPFVHRKLIIGCILGSIVFAWLLLLVWPPTFVSEAKLMIRVGRESVAVDPTATVASSQTLYIQRTRMEEVNSALGVLDSRKVRESVVEQLGAENILEGSLSSESAKEQGSVKKLLRSSIRLVQSAARNVIFATGLTNRIGDTELAIRSLEKSVELESIRESSVITIAAKAKSPEMARAIAASVTRAFIQNHMEVTRTPGATDFFERQTSELENKLDVLVGERTEFMQEHELMSVANNQEILRTELVAISTELAKATGQLMQAEGELGKALTTLASLPKMIVASTLERENAAYSGMRQTLFELEAKAKRLEASLTDEHPLRAVVDGQISELREVVDLEQPKLTDDNTTPNPAVQRVEAVVQDLRAKIAGLGSLIEKKQLQRAGKSREVEELLSHEIKLATMDRNIKVMESGLDSMKVKLQHSNVIDQMGTEQMSNVSVFQPASLIERPVSPRKKIVAFMMVAMGSMLGLAWAFMRECASEVLRSEDHLRQFAFATPVYGLERLRGVHLRQNRRSNRREAPKPLQHLCKHILGDALLSEEWGEQQRIGVLSYERGSGTSMLARELALACSKNSGIATTLVDTDLENQTVAKSFGLKGSVLVEDFVAGNKSMDECTFDQGENLRVMPLASSKGATKFNGSLDGLIDRLKHLPKEAGVPHNHVAVLDLPPVRDYPEAAAVARTLDSIVLVVESEKTTASELDKMLRYLEGGDARVLCFVLNKTKRHVPRWVKKALGAN